MTETYYKFLTPGGVSPYAVVQWHLPKGKRPGKWMPKVERLEICETGYHCVDRDHVLDWLNTEMYEVEVRGDRLSDGGKIAAQQARLVCRVENWNNQRARLFAADCAAFAQSFVNSPDQRSIDAIDVAREYAYGRATDEQLRAAREAARAAAWDAAWDAAWEAARAARAAAQEAAWDAAPEAARDAARAARAAAQEAAWEAAPEAARDAARAARAAAQEAAWDAAPEAAREVLTTRFWQYIESPEIPEPWPIGYSPLTGETT